MWGLACETTGTLAFHSTLRCPSSMWQSGGEELKLTQVHVIVNNKKLNAPYSLQRDILPSRVRSGSGWEEGGGSQGWGGALE